MKKNKELERKEKTSKVFLLNKRDMIDEYIFNSVTSYNEYLSSKNSSDILSDLNSLLNNKKQFLNDTKRHLKRIDDMKEKVIDKKNDLVIAIKNYANNFIVNDKDSTEKSVLEIELDYNQQMKKINQEIENIENDKISLSNLKLSSVNDIKSKINKIQKQVNNKSKFDLNYETQEILNLTDAHKKLIKDDMKLKVNTLNSKLEKLNIKLTHLNSKRIKDIFKIAEASKMRIKDEFAFLSNIEKVILKKIIKFRDFLTDVEYFANDKTEKYEILVSKAKVIKAENFNNLMKDTNTLLSFVSNSESIFDNADFLINNIKQKMGDQSIDNKLIEFKKSLLNSNSSKLLFSNVEKGDS